MVHSLITLFPPTATVFDTNGLGSLGEAISCTVTEERNGSFELEMVYPVTGNHYPDIVKRSIIYVKPNPVDPPQAFRIYGSTKPMNGLVTYQAEHISYDLSGYPVKPFTAKTCTQAFLYLKSNSVISHPFTFYTDKSNEGNLSVTTPTPTRSVLGGSEDSILDVFGGEYKFDNFDVRLYNHRGMNRGVVIRYGKNLTDIKQEENISNVYTDILPYWYGEVDEIPELVTLPELTIATSSNFYFHRVLPLDMSSSFSEKPFVVDLRDAANAWITENNPSAPSTSFDLSFAQLEQTEEYGNLALLERVELCDEVTVEYPEFGISATAKVIKTVYDVMAGSYKSVTLGDVKATLTQVVSGQEGELRDAANSLRDGFRNDLKGTADSLRDGFTTDLNNTAGSLREGFTNDLNDARDEFNTGINDARDEFNTGLNGLRDDFTKALEDTKTDLEKATENATDWITNGRGYMVAVKNEIGQWIEICSLDNPDISSAVNVWRWNNGGFGHSSHGYNGPYEVAITQDGKINANFILTGSLSANLITTGSLSANLITTGILSANLIRSGILNGITIITEVEPISYEKPGNRVTMANGRIDFEKLTPTYSYLYGSIYAGTTYPTGGPLVGREVEATIFKSGENNVIELRVGSYPLLQAIPKELDGLTFDESTVCIYGDASIMRMLMVYSDINCDGTIYGTVVDSEIVSLVSETENYSSRTLPAYSMTSSMRGDIGEGQTDENGECYISLNDIFLETISETTEYQVFLQKEGPGDIWVSEKGFNYFVVKGTENLKFAWEIKAKQKNTETSYMERTDIKENNTIDYEQEYIFERREFLKENDYESQYYLEIKDLLKEREEVLYQ